VYVSISIACHIVNTLQMLNGANGNKIGKKKDIFRKHGSQGITNGVTGSEVKDNSRCVVECWAGDNNG
jgi:hypothetical protein